MPQIILPRLYERDIDVLLQEELIFNEHVRNLLANALNLTSMHASECSLSVMDATGETDLVAKYSCNNRNGILLIENKIDAEFQPLQPERYNERAIRLMKEGDCDVNCLLIAPRRYVDSANQEQLASFAAIISYEDVATAIAKEGTSRSKHRSGLILRAIEQARRAYVLVPAPEVGNFWGRVYGIASAEFVASIWLLLPTKGVNPSGSSLRLDFLHVSPSIGKLPPPPSIFHSGVELLPLRFNHWCSRPFHQEPRLLKRAPLKR
jgi:hypothetical protein